MSQKSSNFKNIFMSEKIHYRVFFKNHAAVTPELVVNRLRRINTYIWLFNKSYSQFVQKTFGNTGQQQDAIRISVFNCCCKNCKLDENINKILLACGRNITLLLRRNKMKESQNIVNEKRTDLFIKYDEIM